MPCGRGPRIECAGSGANERFYGMERSAVSVQKLQMGTHHRQGQLTLIGNLQLPVDALGVGLDRPDGQAHVARNTSELFAVEDVLNQLQLTTREAESVANLLPLLSA